jgi:hypothetical protein
MSRPRCRLPDLPFAERERVAHCLPETVGVSDTGTDMIPVLHLVRYVYKKTKLVPGKTDAQPHASSSPTPLRKSTK